MSWATQSYEQVLTGDEKVATDDSELMQDHRMFCSRNTSTKSTQDRDQLLEDYSMLCSDNNIIANLSKEHGTSTQLLRDNCRRSATLSS